MIPLCEPALHGNELKYVTECIETNWISSAGKFVGQFEQQFAAYVGAPQAVAMSNGTAALHVALRLLDVGPGDEVIVPTLTFIASVNAVSYTGATPVFIDAEPETWNIDPWQIEERITPRTRALLPAHIFGHPANLDPLLAAARRHDLPVVEDACETLGASYKGRATGTWGTMGCFSFNGNKLITTGGGGMLVTADEELARRARFLSTQARSDTLEYTHSEIGYNYRLTNLQAAVGMAQLEQIAGFLARKRCIADRYRERLGALPGLTPMPELPWAVNAFWLYSMLVEQRLGGSRPLIAHLARRGIQARPFFTPAHRLPMYAAPRDESERFPVAERLYQEGINLPSSVTLTTEQQDEVIEAVEEYIHGLTRP